MGRILPKHLGGLLTIDRGHWMREGSGALVSCPDCAEIQYIPSTHSIEAGGRVVPRWRCFECHLAEWLTLEAW